MTDNIENKGAGQAGGADHGNKRNLILPAAAAAAVVIAIIIINVVISALPSKEDKWQDQYDLGLKYLVEADYEQAVISFTSAIKIDPDNPAAYLGRAEAYLEGDTDSASKEALTLAGADYSTAISLDSTLADAYEGRGDVFFALGETEENLTAAISDYDSAIALDSARTELYAAEAEIYTVLKDYEHAVKAYTKAEEAGIRESGIYLGRAAAYRELGVLGHGDFSGTEQGIVKWRIVNILDGTLPGAELTEEEKQYLLLALNDYLTAIGQGGCSSYIYLTAAETAILAGDYGSADQILKEVLEEGTADPGDATLELLSGIADEGLSRLEQEAQAASIEEQIGTDNMECLLALTKALEAGPETLRGASPLNDGFYQYAASLTEPLILEQGSGKSIAIYPDGYIYYGEMENGVRSGTGCGFLDNHNGDYGSEWSDSCLLYHVTMENGNGIYYGSWSNDLPNGPGKYYINLALTDLDILETWCFDMDFADGYVNGSGKFITTDSGDSEGECAVQADNGNFTALYDYMAFLNELAPVPAGITFDPWYVDALTTPGYYIWDFEFAVHVVGAE